MSKSTLPLAIPASRLFPGTGVCSLRCYPVCAGEGEEQSAAESLVRTLPRLCQVPASVLIGREAHRSLLLIIAEGQQGDAPAGWADQERT